MFFAHFKGDPFHPTESATRLRSLLGESHGALVVRGTLWNATRRPRILVVLTPKSLGGVSKVSVSLVFFEA